MQTQLTAVHIQGYKSIEQGNIDVSDVSVLIGKNNSGKSNFIDSMATVQEIEEKHNNNSFSQKWYQKRIISKESDEEFQISLIFKYPESRRQAVVDDLTKRRKQQRRLNSKIEGGSTLNKIRYEISVDGTGRSSRSTNFYVDEGGEWVDITEFDRTYDALNKKELRDSIRDFIKSWSFVDPFRVPRDIGTAGYTTELNADGGNLIKVLNSLQTNHPKIFESIASSYVEIMDGITEIAVEYDPDRNPTDMTIVVYEESFDVKFKSEDISSGSKEILVLLTQIYWASENSDVLFLEEPELHLHPGAERKVFNLIQNLVSEKAIQVIISTHSDVFVDQTKASSITRVDREGRTVLRSIKPEEVDVELQDLGYEQSRLLQSEMVIFVEGLSDKRILKQFGKTAGVNFESVGVRIVELEGVDNMKKDSKSLVKLLSSFEIPHLFVIDRHDQTTKEAQGELYDSMTRSDGKEWWNASLENIFVWKAYGIEEYLLNPRAISEDFEMSREGVQEIIDDNSDIDDKEEVLKTIYAEEHSDLENPDEMYNKSTDGLYISKRMKPNELSQDVLHLFVEIANRVEKVDLDELEPEMPDELKQ